MKESFAFKLFWAVVNLIAITITILAAFASQSKGADCQPFFRSRYHAPAHHADYVAPLVERTFYYSAGPFVEGRAAFNYAKATDPEFASYERFKKLRLEYKTFEEFEAAEKKAAAVTAPIVLKRCNACHTKKAAIVSTKHPELGELVFDGETEIPATHATAATRAVIAGTMPQGAPLTDAEKPDFLDQILKLEAK